MAPDPLDSARAAQPPADDAVRVPAALGRLARVDFAQTCRLPGMAAMVVASIVALAGSLGLDVLVVHECTVLYPSTRAFPHFRWDDYGTLTVVGVLVGCAAWPAVVRVSSAPRWLFARLAVFVTVVLWVPDLALLAGHQPAAGVGALMVMHLAVAVATYGALALLAPARPLDGPPPPAEPLAESTVRHLWNAMAGLVGVELVVGVATIVVVPYRRPSALLPAQGMFLYVVHAALGLGLGAGAIGLLVAAAGAPRLARVGATLGAAGVALGVGGGALASAGPTRLLGMGLMLVATVLAGIGYLVPTMDAFGRAEAARAEAARAEAARAEAARAQAAPAQGAPADGLRPGASRVGDEDGRR